MKRIITIGIWFGALLVYVFALTIGIGHADVGLMFISWPAYALTGAVVQLWILGTQPTQSTGVLSWLLVSTLSLAVGFVATVSLIFILALFGDVPVKNIVWWDTVTGVFGSMKSYAAGVYLVSGLSLLITKSRGDA